MILLFSEHSLPTSQDQFECDMEVTQQHKGDSSIPSSFRFQSHTLAPGYASYVTIGGQMCYPHYLGLNPESQSRQNLNSARAILISKKRNVNMSLLI